MNTQSKTVQGWVVIGLLFAFMMLNYADKCVLGLVAVPMMRDMKLSATQFGLLGSAFFLLYSISGIAFGMLAYRVKARSLVFVLAIIWALVQFPLALPVGFGTVVVSRVLLGLGEGPAYPLALHVAYKWFDDHRRSVPTSIVQSGAAVGIMVASPALTWVMERYSWRAAFLALGVVGLAWAALWLLFGAEGPSEDRAQAATAAAAAPLPAEPVPFARLLFDPTFTIVTFQWFLAMFVTVLALTWGPVYLRLSLGYSAKAAGWIYASQVAIQVPLGLAVNALSQHLIVRGVSTRIARGVFCSACCAIGALAYLVLLSAAGPAIKLAFLTIGGILVIQVNAFGPQMIAQITPAPQRATVLAVSTSLAATAGVIGPALLGRVMDAVGTHQAFVVVYLGIGAALLISAAFGVALLDPERSQRRLAALARHDELRVTSGPVA